MRRVFIALVGALVLSAGCGSTSEPTYRGAPRERTQTTTTQALSTAVGHTYFVAMNGRDVGPGSIRRPWRTIAHGLAAVRAGDRMFVRGGLYVEHIFAKPAPGRANAPILVAGYRHEQPLIVGQLWIGEARYFTLAGINVTWSPTNPDAPMVRFYGGSNWALRDAQIFGAHATSALHVDDGPNHDLGRWRVIDNCIHDTMPTNGENQDHNVYIDDMSLSPNPRGVIAHNLIFGAANGRGIKLGPGGTTGGPRNVVIRDNTIYDQVENLSVSQGTSNVVITHNILMRARDANIGGFELRGVHDYAVDNVAGEAPHLVLNSGGTHVVGNNQNRYPESVSFDSISCTGFHPSAWQHYGKYG